MGRQVRESIKVLLFNQQNQLLMLCAEDPNITTVDGRNYGRYWFPLGGGIEAGESRTEAALRELFEETGIAEDEVELGPTVWHGEFDYCRFGEAVTQKEFFVVAHTDKQTVCLDNLTPEEKAVTKGLRWFSHDELERWPEIIFPVGLPEYLGPILEGDYPPEPVHVDLAKEPNI